MSAIPLEYLKKIGSYRNMKVHGETVTVIADAAETSALTESRIADFRSHLVRNNVKVVGVDSKEKKRKVISAGKLAAMVLKKPGLTTSALASIAKEAGIQYDGPSFESKAVIEVDWRNPKVLTAEMVKIAINDAVAHYLIGCKLFKMLDDN
ncbi:Isoleucine--tRNA ligase [Bienertia sinuspersici]